MEHKLLGALRPKPLAWWKSLRRLAVLAALCGTVVLAGWVAAGRAGLGLPGIENTGTPIDASRATSATARAEYVDTPQEIALGEGGVSLADMGSGSAALSDPRSMQRPVTPPAPIASVSTPDPVRNEAKEAAGSVEVVDMGSGNAALPDPPPMPRPAAPPVLFAAVSSTDPVQNAARPAISSEALDACLEPDVCIDQYLWSLYERTPKVDTVKVEERIKVKVKNKNKNKNKNKKQEQGQDADRRQNSDEVHHRELRVEGSDSRAESRPVVEGLRDRRHGSGLQTEAVRCASRDRRRRAFAWHNQRIPR